MSDLPSRSSDRRSRTADSWTCSCCGDRTDGIVFHALSARSLPDREAYRYGECTRCGSLSLLDLIDPSPWYLDDYERHRSSAKSYPATAATLLTGAVGDWFVRHVRVRPAWWMWRHPSWIAMFRGTSVDRRSPILDVGCGQGAQLMHLSRFGFTDLHGIDPYLRTPSAPGAAIQLSRTSLEDVHGEYGAVTFVHSLEHMDDPLEQLQLAVARLSSGGAVVVSLPIAGGRSWRRFGENWAGLDAPLHRFLPSPEGLFRLAERAGLRVLRWHGSTPTYFYSSSLQIQSGASPFSDAATGLLDDRVRRWCATQAQRDRGRDASEASFILVRS